MNHNVQFKLYQSARWIIQRWSLYKLKILLRIGLTETVFMYVFKIDHLDV